MHLYPRIGMRLLEIIYHDGLRSEKEEFLEKTNKTEILRVVIIFLPSSTKIQRCFK